MTRILERRPPLPNDFVLDDDVLMHDVSLIRKARASGKSTAAAGAGDPSIWCRLRRATLPSPDLFAERQAVVVRCQIGWRRSDMIRAASEPGR